MAEYTRNAFYVSKGDRIANSYCINLTHLNEQRNCSSKFVPSLKSRSFFHLFDLDIPNSYIPLSSCGVKIISHRDFRLTLVRNLLAQAGQERNVSRPIGRSPAAATQVVRLEERARKHWPIPSDAQISFMFFQWCHQKSFSEVPNV